MIKEEVQGYWKFAIVLLLIFYAVTIILNSIIRDSFYNESLNFITQFQAKSNKHLDIFMNLLSLLVNTNYLIAVLAIIYISHKAKITGLVFLSYFLMNTYFMNVLKLSYQEPRPFWFSHRVKELEWGCPNQFGNPSGHSYMALLIYEPLVTDFAGSGVWNLGYVFPVLAAVLVPISRMYLGAHAGNEVVMGLTLGTIMCALYRIKFQEWLYKLFSKLDWKKVTQWGYIGIAFINCLLIITPIIIYSVNLNTRPISQSYLANLNSACGKSYTSSQIQAGAMEAHAIINIVFGFLFGAAASDNTNFFYFTGQWMFNSVGWWGKTLKFTYKLILQILIAAPAPVILSIVIPKYTHISPYLSYFLMCVGYWLFGFILVAYSNRILLKCDIIIHYSSNEHDKMKITKPITEDHFIEA